MTPTPRIRNRLPVAVTLAAVAFAGPASAVDGFEDVSPNSAHAGAIGDVAEAGITTGCDVGRFCPGDDVSREQMASFLARSGSRAEFASSVAELSAANGYDGVPASTTVRASGATGGVTRVTLSGSVSVYTEGAATSCPCEVEAFVYRASDDAQGPSSWSQLPSTTTGSGRVATSLPVHWMVEIPSGSTETFHLAVFLNDGTPNGVTAEAALSAVATPF